MCVFQAHSELSIINTHVCRTRILMYIGSLSLLFIHIGVITH